jgi:hypothetical protein
MVEGMVRRSVDVLLERVTDDEVRVVNEDGPELDADEEAEVEVPVEGQNADDDVVRQALQVAVDGVEGEGSEGSGDAPLVVRLMHVLVQGRVVLETVNPVDSQVGD